MVCLEGLEGMWEEVMGGRVCKQGLGDQEKRRQKYIYAFIFT